MTEVTIKGYETTFEVYDAGWKVAVMAGEMEATREEAQVVVKKACEAAGVDPNEATHVYFHGAKSHEWYMETI
jgi:F0F1-type ATP synthase epsilon subunit